MTETIMVGLLSLAGTLIGTVAGILTANKLTNYRISQLEIKMDKYNGVKDRMIEVETSVKSAHHRIDEIKGARV